MRLSPMFGLRRASWNGNSCPGRAVFYRELESRWSLNENYLHLDVQVPYGSAPFGNGPEDPVNRGNAITEQTVS
jgi:hypothetical protein